MRSLTRAAPSGRAGGERDDTHYAPLCDYVYGYVRSRAVAQDLVQDLFLRLWERAPAPAGALAASYLYTAARNRAVGHLRRERVAAAWANDPNCATRATPAADEPLREHELLEAIDSAVAALPDRCRLIFTLSRYRRLTNADIARMLCISVNTVEQQMWRALKSLRVKLAPYLQ
jgi:RNA polymerase sigma-70 factor (ECF subfamily)